VLAGNVPPDHQRFFDAEIRPCLDGDRVAYVGAVDDTAKSELLSGAAALLMPIQWEEPFGVVMAEALACGTPVIGLARGAVPEVVEPGVTGYVCGDLEALIAAVADLRVLDRTACRRAAERRFSQTMLVDAYETLYRELTAAPAAGRSAVTPVRQGSIGAGGDR
jgi:glycosyltransferase involved in cell wall biosynthesis